MLQTSGGTINGAATMKSSMEGLQTLKTKNYQYDPVITLLHMYQKKKKPDLKICTHPYTLQHYLQ